MSVMSAADRLAEGLGPEKVQGVQSLTESYGYIV